MLWVFWCNLHTRTQADMMCNPLLSWAHCCCCSKSQAGTYTRPWKSPRMERRVRLGIERGVSSPRGRKSRMLSNTSTWLDKAPPLGMQGGTRGHTSCFLVGMCSC